MQVPQQTDTSVGREQSGCLQVCLRNKLFVRGGFEMLLLGGEAPIQWDSLFLFCLLKWEKKRILQFCTLFAEHKVLHSPQKAADAAQLRARHGTAPPAQKQTLLPLLPSGKINNIPGQLFSCPKYSFLQSPLFLCFQRNVTSWLMYL